MNKKSFEERDAAVSRGRQRSRLVGVSSVTGEQMGVPASAGAPVESKDEPQRRRGIRIPELIWEAILATQDPEHARFRVSVNWDGTEELLPVQRPSSLKKQRAKLAGRAIAQDPGARLGSRQTQRDGRFWPKVNPEALAKLLGVSRATAYRWAREPSVLEWAEKMRQPGPKGREALLQEQIEAIDARIAAMDARLAAVQQDVRDSLVVLLENFPGNSAVADAVQQFLDDALAD